MSIDKKQLKEHVLKCGKETTEAYKLRFRELDEWQKRFDARRSTASLDDDIKRYPWQGAANVGIPLEQTVVYTLQSRFIKAEFGLDPSCVVQPYDLPYAPAIQRFINWELYNEMELFIEKLLWYQGMLIDGDKIIKTVVDKEEVYFDDDTVLYFDEDDNPLLSKETGSPVEAESEDVPPVYDAVKMKEYKAKEAVLAKNRTVYYGPRTINIPAKCFLVPQNADNINPSKLEWCIHEFWRPFGWVHQKSEQHPEMFDKEEVRAMRKDKDKSRAIQEDPRMKASGIDFKTKTKMFKFHEWHGRWEDDDGHTHELIALCCPDEKRFLGFVPNRFYFKTGRRQFVHYCAFPQDGKFWSRGVPEILRGIRSMLDALVNTGLDRNSLHGNPPLLFNLKMSGFDPTEHKFGPGKSWGLRNITPEMIRVLELPTSPMNDFEYEQLLFSIVQKVFGINDVGMSGTRGLGGSVAGATSKTAHGVAQLIQESNIRFDVYIRMLQQWSNPELALQTFKHFAMNRFSIMKEADKHNLNKPKEVFDPIMKLSDDEINKNFEYSFPGNTDTINPIVEQQSVTALWNLFGKAGVPMVSDDPEVMNRLIQQSFNCFGSKIKIKTVDQYREMMATEKKKATNIREAALKKEMNLPGGMGEQEGQLLGAEQ